jgi:hypothetical protein
VLCGKGEGKEASLIEACGQDWTGLRKGQTMDKARGAEKSWSPISAAVPAGPAGRAVAGPVVVGAVMIIVAANFT